MGKGAVLKVLQSGQPGADDVFVPDPSLDPSLLLAKPHGLMVEYTSRCNLRCKYCTKSNAGDDAIPGRNMDMESSTIHEVLGFIARSSFREVLLAGTGESTFHPDWKTDIPRLICAAKAANPRCFVHFNSNMAQRYGDDAFAVLAQLDGIMVSIDTADADVTREVRAKSDLAVIVYNLTRLRAFCRERGLRLPRIVVNSTVHDQACEGLPALVSLLADLPVAHLALSDMVETDGARRHGIRAINKDDPERFAKNVQSLSAAIKRAKDYGKFSLSVQPFLAQRLNELQRGAPAAQPGAQAANDQGARTKLCTQPWSRFTVAADASLFPCCNTNMDPVGSLAPDADPERDGIDGTRIQSFRQELLLGRPPAVCVDCSNAQSGSARQLQDTVRDLKQRG
jgi:molybdenum cofactor biosynthesis enzyme MoaA